MQCTPDINYLDCNQCLVQAIANLPSCCGNKIGGRVIRPSCNLRYENYRFYELNVQPPPPPPTSPSTNHKGMHACNPSIFIIII
jgi:hypothetical protein